jgi:protein-S-isoprenylcysteine O-methyltransferase Ste14
VGPPACDVRLLAALVLVGDLFVAVSYACLGGSFSILVEARPLKDRGPYRFIRHPVYLGQLVTFLGVALARFAPVEMTIYAAFFAVQVTRAILEERKLSRATPGYADYRAKTWMFVPFVV